MAISLLPLIIILGLIPLIILLSDRRTRLVTSGLLVTGLMILGIIAMSRTSQRGAPSMAANYQFTQPAIPPPPTMRAPTTTKASGTANSIVEEPAASSGKPTVEESSKSKTQSGTTVIPDWMKQPIGKQGDIYIVPVESGVYSDPSVREQMLDVKMLAAANRYIDEVLYRQGGVADAVAFEPEYIQNFVHDRTVSPAGDETFVRLEFNQRFRDDVAARYRNFLSLSKIEQLGGVALGIFGLLGGLYAYLRLTNPRSTSPAEPISSTA